jgi:hypothetical protein
VLNANSVKIKSVIDLNGYKVVVQRWQCQHITLLNCIKVIL